MSTNPNSDEQLGWAVNLKLHSVLGLPRNDLIVKLQVSSPGDPACSWSTAAVPSFNGTAFLGAWTTIVVQNNSELKLDLGETAPMLEFLKGGIFNATAVLDLSTFGPDVEGGSGPRETTILMESTHRSKRVAEALDKSMEGVVKAAEGTALAAEAVQKKISEAVSKPTPPAEEQETEASAAVAAATDIEAGKGEPPAEEPHQGGEEGGGAGFFSTGSVTLRASIEAIPLSQWMHQTGTYAFRGCALEQSVSHSLPRSLHSYAHGGFMGLACTVLADPKWSEIMQRESPEGWSALQTEILKMKITGKKTPPSMLYGKFMVVLENSPVLCAYGLVRTQSTAPVGTTLTAGGGDGREGEERKAAAAIAGLQTPVATAPEIFQAPGAQVMAAGVEAFASSSGGSAIGRSVQRKKTGALLQYQAAMSEVNCYGYRPVALEWDIWVNPRTPASLESATINHGTSGALVTQAVLTTVPGLKCAARQAGSIQINSQGISPVEWLTQLGHSVNSGANGDRDVPLPLYGPQETYWKLELAVEAISGLVRGGAGDKEAETGAESPKKSAVVAWDNVRVAVDVDSDDVVLPEVITKPAEVAPDGTATWTYAPPPSDTPLAAAPSKMSVSTPLEFWPLPSELEHDDLLLTVQAVRRGMTAFRRHRLGLVRLKLDQVVAEHPRLTAGEDAVLELVLGPMQDRRVNIVRNRHAGDGGDDDEEEIHNIATEEEEEGGSSPKLSQSASAAAAASAVAAGEIRLRVRMRLRAVGVIDAMEAMGVPRPAAQTAAAMLRSPGGLYLDVKSAYSTAYDLQLFVSSLRGVGITPKAVCSFKLEQLAMGSLVDTVLFFHGLSGVENAADAGGVPPGQFVLFNGASFLVDIRPSEMERLGKRATERVVEATEWPIDQSSVEKYRSLCEQYGIVGGIYVQEPDIAPSGIDSLCRLITENPEDFPLGFAYGHLPGRAVGFLDAKGRGFASQQIVEEFAARKDLSGKTIKRIRAGEHREASLATITVWAGRLLHGEDWMTVNEQRALCTLLAEVEPDAAVAAMVESVGGVGPLVARTHQHYEMTTPLTLLEAGLNHNYTKSVVRLLRNRGVLAALPLEDKCDLARFFVGPVMRGYGATYLAQASGMRRGLHKHAKEGLLCLLESCTAKEVAEVERVLGGRKKLESRLRGWLWISFVYNRRLRDVDATHKEDPQRLAYTNAELKYAALPRVPVTAEGGKVDMKAAAHTRDKLPRETAFRAVRKSFCCGFTCGYSLLLEALTLGTFIPCCVLPRVCGNALKGACGLPAVFAFILGFIIAMGIIIFLAFIKDQTAPKPGPGLAPSPAPDFAQTLDEDLLPKDVPTI